MAQTPEFRRTGGMIFAESNLVACGLPEFLGLPEARIVVDRMADRIAADHGGA